MIKNSFQEKLQQLGKQAKAERRIKELHAAQEKKQHQVEDMSFAELMGAEVVPLKSRNQFVHHRDNTPIRVRPKQTVSVQEGQMFYIGDNQQDIAPAVFSKNGRGVHDIRRLQAKQWPIVAYVDLHGYRQDEAQEVLNEFIDYIQRYGVVGEIVHGSGLGSKDYQPVLKNLVRCWLMAHPEVLAYAQPNERNDGAVYVLVKRRQRQQVSE